MESNKYICPFCGKELTTGRGLGGHKSKCLLNPNRTTNKGKKINYYSSNNTLRDDLFCRYCGKQCKNLNSLKQHEIRCKENPDKIKSPSRKGECNIPKDKRGWSKGLSKESDIRLKNVSKGLKKHYETCDGNFKGKRHSEITKRKMSDNARNNNFQSHWGLRKTFEYKGLKFQSSYEVDTAKSLDLNNIKWEKPEYGTFTYIDLNCNKHTYTPDFYLPDYNVYLDPKNDYLIENINPSLGYCDKDKITWVMEQNNVKIIILGKDQLDWNIIKTLL